MSIYVGDGHEQDYYDGEALRRLREALPEGWQWVVYGPHDPFFVVTVKAIDVDAEVPNDRSGSAATIAEAADKCREALER